MFYYFSFLRPPPVRCRIDSAISITPEVANDLRTDQLQNAQDIYYQWLLNSNPGDKPVTPTLTKSTKLTTWRQVNAYKELSIPPPPMVKEGQSWNLILSSGSTTPSTPNYIINLNEDKLGRKDPFPIMSMPIVFRERIADASRGKVQKQDRIQRVYELFPSGSNAICGDRQVQLKKPLRMVITEQTSFDLDKKIWDSGIGLSSWIVRLCRGQIEMDREHSSSLKTIKQKLLAREALHTLELGAGTGVVTITLAALRTALAYKTHALDSEEEDRSIHDVLYTTDLPSAIPLLQHNINSNIHLYHESDDSKDTPIRAVVLDWDTESLPEEILENLNSKLDILIMADVTYNVDSFPSLIQTINRLSSSFSAGTTSGLAIDSGNPLIILGYKQRHEAERNLWEMSKEIGISFVKVGEVVGYEKPSDGVEEESTPVEVWACIP